MLQVNDFYEIVKQSHNSEILISVIEDDVAFGALKHFISVAPNCGRDKDETTKRRRCFSPFKKNGCSSLILSFISKASRETVFSK